MKNWRKLIFIVVIMDNWKKQSICEYLGDLAKNIKCNVQLICYLQQEKVLSDSEAKELMAIGESGGEYKQSSYLLEILQNKTRGCEVLAKILQECRQTGAFTILLKGIQKHIIFMDVLFDGVRLPLQNVSKSIDQDSLKDIIASEVNAETLEEILNLEPWILETETIPKEIPYYIPRTLSINTQIDPEIFQKLENDVFCIEGMELHQMSNLVSCKTKKHHGKAPNLPDWSRNQIHGVSTRFIRLERSDHFPDIAEKSKKPVHWLKYNAGKYWHVKSSPTLEVKNARQFLVSNCLQNLTEDEFIERCGNVSGNEPVFLYDSPGMGKSVLLAKLARKMKECRPADSVIHFEFSELVRKVRQVDESCSCAAIKEALINHIAVNRLGRRIMRNLLNSMEHQIQLFLDGYDEVHQSDSSDAHRILFNLVNDGANFHIFVATRRHRRNELEEKFGVLGYNILPFDHSNKLDFFLKYWESEHSVKITDGTKEFAEHCLEAVASEMSGDDDESDIAGIPLQCRMLAEIYAKDAKRGGLIPTESQLHLNSIFEVYKHYINTKFSSMCTDAERQICYDFHLRESIRTLFPEHTKHFYEELPVPENELIYRIGILEPLRSDPTSNGFSHRTLAEYFVADLLIKAATSNSPDQLFQIKIIDLFFQQALVWSIDDKNEISFQYPVVCRFMNFFLSPRPAEDFGAVKSELKVSNCYNPKTLIGLLEMSLKVNAVHLYLFLLQVYLDLIEFCYETTSSLRFKDNLQHTECWQVKDAHKYQLVIGLKKEPKFNKLVAIAIRHSSLHLVKLSNSFLENVTGKNVHQIPYDRDRNPIRAAALRGHYQIFEYILSFDRKRFYQNPLLHWCLQFTSGLKVVGDKEQILKLILHERPDLLNKAHPHHRNYVPLLADRVHFSLIKFLIEAGAHLTQTPIEKENIAHRTAEYFSADEFHEFVEFIIAHNGQMIFTQRDWMGLTPVHSVLRRLNLKTKTLELLANSCNVTFNDNFPDEGSELAMAIFYKRSERVIGDIERLGGSRKKLYKRDKRDCIIF